MLIAGAACGYIFFSFILLHDRPVVMRYLHPHIPYRTFVRQTFEGALVSQDAAQGNLVISVPNTFALETGGTTTPMRFSYDSATLWGVATFMTNDKVVIARRAATTAPRILTQDSEVSILMDTYKNGGALRALSITSLEKKKYDQ